VELPEYELLPGVIIADVTSVFVYLSLGAVRLWPKCGFVPNLYKLSVEDESELHLDLRLPGLACARTLPLADEEFKRGPNVFFHLVRCINKSGQQQSRQ
jgi:hypothetical protein